MIGHVPPSVTERGRRIAGLGTLVAVLRTGDPQHVLSTVEVLVEAGVHAVEISTNTPGYEDLIRRSSGLGAGVIGAGTVTTPELAARSLQAGARFLVTPTLEEDVVVAANAAQVPVLCGAFTPTEVRRAWGTGADAVKVFPARLGGPAYLRDLHGPLPEILLVPSGGVAAADVPAYLAAGAVAVAIGGRLVGPALDDGDIAETRRRLASLMASLPRTAR